MADVFVSYAREDQPFVRRLHGALAAPGCETWVERITFLHGEDPAADAPCAARSAS